MNSASVPVTVAVHPLVAQLSTRHGFAELSIDAFDGWASEPGRALVVFTEDPVRYKETLDLAVIAPELLRAFPGVFRAGVLLPDAARAIRTGRPLVCRNPYRQRCASRDFRSGSGQTTLGCQRGDTDHMT